MALSCVSTDGTPCTLREGAQATDNVSDGQAPQTTQAAGLSFPQTFHHACGLKHSPRCVQIALLLLGPWRAEHAQKQQHDTHPCSRQKSRPVLQGPGCTGQWAPHKARLREGPPSEDWCRTSRGGAICLPWQKHQGSFSQMWGLRVCIGAGEQAQPCGPRLRLLGRVWR